MDYDKYIEFVKNTPKSDDWIYYPLNTQIKHTLFVGTNANLLPKFNITRATTFENAKKFTIPQYIDNKQIEVIAEVNLACLFIKITDIMCKLTINVLTRDSYIMANEPITISQYSGITDEMGRCVISVPNNNKYTIRVADYVYELELDEEDTFLTIYFPMNNPELDEYLGSLIPRYKICGLSYITYTIMHYGLTIEEIETIKSEIKKIDNTVNCTFIYADNDRVLELR